MCNTYPKVAVLSSIHNNYRSVSSALFRVGTDPLLVPMTDIHSVDFAMYDAVAIPGVGSWDNVVSSINTPMSIVLRELFFSTKPVLAICIGMQIMFTSSEEGLLPGLNLLPGTVQKLPTRKTNYGLLPTYSTNSGDLTNSYYFMNSYGVAYSDDSSTYATKYYMVGDHLFIAETSFNNNTLVQFHPERSGSSGTAFMRSWVNQIS